jgi:DNA-binding winged helix-turn-helix (wHTH) protein/Flp pilus assembly protein TadD
VSASTLRFTPFAIDVKRQQLLRNGEMVDLSPHLVEILSHLAAHHGETVSKNDLLDKFWPDVHVTENTLTRAIADIRSALEDDAAEPKFIQTVARRGYRFIAPVEAAAPPPKDPFADWTKGKLSLELLDVRQLADATRAFEKAVEATPAYAPAHAGLASACFLEFERTRSENMPRRDALERAITHARRACELDPALGEAWATLGFALLAAGQTEQARAAARQATMLEPSNWRHHFRLAVASWGEERLRSVDRTLALHPEFAQARFLAAMVFIARQAFATAEDLIRKGAARQTQEAGAEYLPFPSFGLHWLHGLMLLRRGEIGEALRAFAREIDTGHQSSVYYSEFQVNAIVASGHGHLAADDADGAVRAFREALQLQPANGRALLGLSRALARARKADEAQVARRQVDETLAALTKGGRVAEAALVTAAAHSAEDRKDDAIATLNALLDHAPPGQVGWQIPVDPALSNLRRHPDFDRLLARVSARAS